MWPDLSNMICVVVHFIQEVKVLGELQNLETFSQKKFNDINDTKKHVNQAKKWKLYIFMIPILSSDVLEDCKNKSD